MCGRFTVTADGETIRGEFGLVEVPFDYRPRYNVAPMQDVLAVVQHGGEARAGWMRWGLVPGWADDPAIGARMINARSETIDEKSAFREAFERRRCLIVADGFYEWRHVGNVKIPMRIRRKDEGLFAFAGLWERWSRHGREPLISCTILTTAPAASIAHIHDRMPVMLSRTAREQWLDRDTAADALKSLLVPAADEDIVAYPVSTLINHVDNDAPECIEPAQPTSAAEQTSLF
ncbi:MAG TPA: SOS response-associated peptidase [Longimicrobiales bacterium]